MTFIPQTLTFPTMAGPVQEAPRASPYCGQLAEALSQAQAKFAKVVKDKKARIASQKGTYEYMYADLASLIDAIKPALAEFGLAYTQIINGDELRTVLMHKSGEKVEGAIKLKNFDRPQELGSYLTYMRRYALSAMVGVASEDDDDGNAAQAASTPKPAAPAFDVERWRAFITNGLSGATDYATTKAFIDNQKANLAACKKADPEAHKMVMALIKETSARLKPVGTPAPSTAGQDGPEYNEETGEVVE